MGDSTCGTRAREPWGSQVCRRFLPAEVQPGAELGSEACQAGFFPLAAGGFGHLGRTGSCLNPPGIVWLPYAGQHTGRPGLCLSSGQEGSGCGVRR